MTQNPIYLDYNATAPLRPEARAAMVGVWEMVGNASSIHAFGRKARLVVEEARAQVAAAVGCAVEEVVFTSGGTEANALALKGVRAGEGASKIVPFVSATAHDSVLKNVGECAVFLPVDSSGVLSLAAMEEALSVHQKVVPFVSVEWVNSETGVIQPIAEIVSLVRRHGGVVHVDAVQALGRVNLDDFEDEDLRPDLLTLSAHKIGGSQGVGALIVRDGFAQREDVTFSPLFGGGGQEKGRRSGTENVAGVAGFGAAVEAALAAMSEDVPRWQKWQAAFEDAVLRVDGAQVIGQGAARATNTSCLVCEGLKADIMLMKLDMAGIAVSSGSACSSGKVGSSSVLRAMGVEADLMRSALRVSWGWQTQEEELSSCAECWTEAVFSARGSV